MFNINKVNRELEMFIFDIMVACEKIKHTIKDFNNAQNLLYDYRAWDSIIREFEIIGEASKYLLKNNLLTKEYRDVVNFRNKITHEYFGIDAEEIWDTVFNDLPDFEKDILNLISNIPQPLKDELIEAFIEDNIYLDFIVEKLNTLKDSYD